ncbi:MAG: hypothetical protein AMS18_12650, partial [Gemmatimonas sp. SG8_17]
GGLNGGLASVGYQSWTPRAVAIPDRPPTASGTTIEISSLIAVVMTGPPAGDHTLQEACVNSAEPAQLRTDRGDVIRPGSLTIGRPPGLALDGSCQILGVSYGCSVV